MWLGGERQLLINAASTVLNFFDDGALAGNTEVDDVIGAPVPTTDVAGFSQVTN